MEAADKSQLLLRDDDLFLLELLRFDGTLAPERRASLNPIAIACLRLFTFFLPPDLSWPCLYSCITLPTFRLPLALLFREELFFFVAIGSSTRSIAARCKIACGAWNE
jgi:hypothetical protein